MAAAANINTPSYLLGSGQGSLVAQGTGWTYLRTLDTNPQTIGQVSNWQVRSDLGFTSTSTNTGIRQVINLQGNGGINPLDADQGNTINAGAGADLVLAGTGADLVHGDEGDDLIYGLAGADAACGWRKRARGKIRLTTKVIANSQGKTKARGQFDSKNRSKTYQYQISSNKRVSV